MRPKFLDSRRNRTIEHFCMLFAIVSLFGAILACSKIERVQPTPKPPVVIQGEPMTASEFVQTHNK
jgi:hypothetical protein